MLASETQIEKPSNWQIYSKQLQRLKQVKRLKPEGDKGILGRKASRRSSQ